MNLIKKLFGRKKEKEVSIMNPSPESLPPEPEPIQINEISPTDLKARLEHDDGLIVVDMRQVWEYESGHIPGAKHMFIQDIPTRLNELPKDTDIVFQCWHGHTSLDVSAYLIQNGWDITRIFSLHGGIAGWASAFGKKGLVQD